MIKIYFSTLLICLFTISCNTDNAQKKKIPQNRTSDLVPEPDIQLRLQADKQIVDSTLIKTKEAALKYIEIEGENKPKLVNISNEEENETEYYIYKDSNKVIKAILELPASKSGDWYLEATYYFDKNGQVYAFQKLLNTFYNSDCESDGKPISVATIEYFQNGKSIYKSTSKRNEKGIEIKDENCSFKDLEIPVYMSLADWSKASNIDLSSQKTK
jgi:hypothetical protein